MRPDGDPAKVVGDPTSPGTDVGPVIDDAAARKIAEYVAIGAKEGKLEVQLPVPDGLAAKVGKPYVGPAIISGVQRDHRIANEEIFGPVLAVLRAKDFDEALAIANATAYKLTGGVYSRKPANLEKARANFRVGNLYLNRGITYSSVKKYKQAIDDFSKAISINPKNVQSYLQRGLAYYADADFQQAVNDFSQVLLLQPNSGAAYYYRGLSGIGLHDNDAALRDLQQAQQLGYEGDYSMLKSVQ